MTKERLLYLMGEAGEPWMGTQKHRFRFPSAAAACLLLLLVLPLVMPGKDKTEVPDTETLVWNGRIYVLVEISERLALSGMDAACAGEVVGTGVRERDGSKVVLRAYQPKQGNPCEALLAVQVADGWRYAVFCNYVTNSIAAPTAAHEPSHLLGLYGVTGPEDIASLKCNGRETGHKEAFTAALMSASYYSEELYQSKIYGGLTEQEQQQKSQSLAESHIQLRLETTSGVVFWMGYQPETGFVDWCLGHYLVG